MLFRSSRPEKLCKKGALKNFAQVWNFIKKRLRHRCFPVKFPNFWKQLFLQNTLGGGFCMLVLALLSSLLSCRLISKTLHFFLVSKLSWQSEVDLGPCKTSIIEFSQKIVYYSKPLTIFSKIFFILPHKNKKAWSPFYHRKYFR